MFYAHDDPLRLLYFLEVGSDLSDAHWEFYTATFEQWATTGGEPPCAVIFEAREGAAPPNAKWRQRFAELGTRTRHDTIFVLVTQSPLARAVLTGVNWIHPFPFRYRLASTRDEAIDFVLRYRSEEGLREAWWRLMENPARVDVG